MSMTPPWDANPTPAPAPVDPAISPAESASPAPVDPAISPAESASPAPAELPALGSLVTHTYFDVYDPTEPGGKEVTKYGVVIAHNPAPTNPDDVQTVVVSWLDHISHALPGAELHVVA